MSQSAALISEMSGAVEIALQFFPDRCSIIDVDDETPDGFGGTTSTETEIESDLEAYVQRLTRTMIEIGGAKITSQTHLLTVRATDNTRAIKPHQKLVIAARELPERTFFDPVTLNDSFAPLVLIAATELR